MGIWSLNLSSLCSTDSTWVTQGIFLPQKPPPHVPRAILQWWQGEKWELSLVWYYSYLLSKRILYFINTHPKLSCEWRESQVIPQWEWNGSRELTQLLVTWEYTNIHSQRWSRSGFRLSITRFNTCIFDSNTRNTWNWYLGGNRMSSHWDLLFCKALFSWCDKKPQNLCTGDKTDYE